MPHASKPYLAPLQERRQLTPAGGWRPMPIEIALDPTDQPPLDMREEADGQLADRGGKADNQVGDRRKNWHPESDHQHEDADGDRRREASSTDRGRGTGG